MKKSIILAACLIFLTAVILYTCSNSGNKTASLGSSQPLPGNGDMVTNPSMNKTTLDATSDGGTITFQNIGATGWYPSLRDPSVGPCDYVNETRNCFGANMKCCQTKRIISSDSLTPWNEDLIMSLRGPMIIKQIAVYQPNAGNTNLWDKVSMWDVVSPTTLTGIAFKGNNTETKGFDGIVGNTCIVNTSTGTKFPCGPGSVPYCPSSSETKYYGWAGSKMIIVQAYMPHYNSGAIATTANCSNDTTGGWHDAPWIGLSLGELVRADCAGQWGPCHCYAKNAAQGYLGDGCGQFNVFEIINDNNQYRNLDVFSSNFFGYQFGGSWGVGPCGSCNATGLDTKVDLINNSTSKEATTGAVGSFPNAPGAAFRRPANGYRFFVMLLDVKTRQVQLAFIHPANVPATVTAVLPGLPLQIQRATVDNMLALRLPGPNSAGVLR
jgi:hypothetical protein